MDMKKALVFGVGGLVAFGLYSIFAKKKAVPVVDEITKEKADENETV